MWNNETHIVCAVVRASADSASYARHFLYFSSSHPTWPALLVVLPEYEDLALYAEKTRELRAHLQPQLGHHFRCCHSMWYLLISGNMCRSQLGDRPARTLYRSKRGHSRCCNRNKPQYMRSLYLSLSRRPVNRQNLYDCRGFRNCHH